MPVLPGGPEAVDLRVVQEKSWVLRAGEEVGHCPTNCVVAATMDTPFSEAVEQTRTVEPPQHRRDVRGGEKGVDVGLVVV